MKRWRCKICGYIHQGDLPPEKCPVCGAGSEDFSELEENGGSSQPESVGRVIIVGNGAAGMQAAQTILEKSRTTEILIFTDEPFRFYSRIHLSSFIGDEISFDKLFIYAREWYQQNRIRLETESRVSKIFLEEKEVEDGLGKRFSYDRLIIATGASSFVPPIKGNEKRGVFVLRNLNHALEILDYIPKCRSAVVIGGGILGVEAASNLNKKGIGVTVVEMADRIMARQLDRQGARVLQQLLEKRGISFRNSSQITEISGREKVERVHFVSGEEMNTDMIIISAGIRPNIHLASEAGIEVKRGILVDEKMRTNFPDVFAAGDVAEFNGQIFGIWPAAVAQGITAAENTLGLDSTYSETMPLHILKVAGIDLTSFGQKKIVKAGENEIVHSDLEQGSYAKLIHNGEFLLGAMVLGIPGVSFRLEKLMKKNSSIKEFLPALKNGEWGVLRRKKQQG